MPSSSMSAPDDIIALDISKDVSKSGYPIVKKGDRILSPLAMIEFRVLSILLVILILI